MFFNHLKQEYSSEAVKEVNGRWYIAMGFSGFNSPANNRFGYDSRQKAEAAIKRYEAKGGKR